MQGIIISNISKEIDSAHIIFFFFLKNNVEDDFTMPQPSWYRGKLPVHQNARGVRL